MVFRKVTAICVAAFMILSSAAVGGESQPHAYVSGEKFLAWPSSARIDYVMGIADALSHLTEITGVQRGLSECLKDSGLRYITLQLITKDAVEEAVAKGEGGSVSVTELFFKQMKTVCRDHYPNQ